MARYAAGTEVSSDRSRSEIERTLRRYGATAFAYGWQGERAVIQFEANGRRIRFELPMPDRDDPEFTMTPTGRERSESAAEQAWEQAGRQRWRALALAVKAKLEAVESGIATFESEFLAYTVLPDNQTVGEHLLPQLEAVYSTGEMPALLPGTSS